MKSPESTRPEKEKTSQKVAPGIHRPSPGHFLRATLAVARKDLLAEIRSRDLLSAMFAFALLVILVFNFALELDVTTRSSVTSGVLWVTFIFAGTLGLNRALAIEKDRSCLDGLLLAPVDRTAVYFGKFISSLAFMLIVEIVVLPVYGLLYNMNLLHPGLLLVILLGSTGFIAAGLLLSSMTIQTRTRDVLLPVVLFPVVLPVVIASVKASAGYLQGLDPADILPWINQLIACDVIFIAVALMTFDLIVEE